MGQHTRSGPKADEVGKRYRVLCATCDHETNHLVVQSAEYTSEYRESGFSVYSWDEYQIVECAGCETVSFRHASRNSEDSFYDEGGDEHLIPTVNLFPHRLAGRRELDHSHFLPFAVGRIYRETLSALRASMPVLAGIGMRALIEAICADKAAVGSNLERKIDDLASKGIISKEGVEILHSLRLMGNKAAHEVKHHSMDALSTGFGVVEHALLGVYILPALSAKLPKRDLPKQAGEAT